MKAHLFRFYTWLCDDDGEHLWARWILLRALGFFFLSAFLSLAPEVHSLVGPAGILPADAYLHSLSAAKGALAFASAPSLLWVRCDDAALTALVLVGIVSSMLLLLNLLPRASAVVSAIVLLSFMNAAPALSHSQPDGILVETGFLGALFAPRGLRPRLGATFPPTRIAYLLLLLEWFRVYFGSGLAKLLTDPSWRDLSAMSDYFDRGPLPTWLAWFASQLPRAFHVAMTAATLAIEIPLVIMAVVTPRIRPHVFAVTSIFQVGILLTANHGTLNYLILSLGVVLLDDRFLARLRLPQSQNLDTNPRSSGIRIVHAGCAIAVVYAAIAGIAPLRLGWFGLPARALAKFRIGQPFNLYSRMPAERHEVEFQGSADGATWTAYKFRYKPQDELRKPPFVAPYHPRFDTYLWYCAQEAEWTRCPLAAPTGTLLLRNDPRVLALFADNPFAAAPPRFVRTMKVRYRFTTAAEKKASGAWWAREAVGTFGPILE